MGVKWPTADWREAPWLYRALKSVLHYPFRGLMRVRAKGMDLVPREGGLVCAPNHFSWADPFAQQVALGRPAYFLAKHSLWRPPASWVLNGTNLIPVDRARGGNEAAVRAAVERVERGYVVAIYPEGTRSRWPELLPFKSGAVRVAALTGAPIVPLGILTDRFWPIDRALPRFGEPVYVNFGAPYRVGKDPALAEDKEFLRKASEDLRQKVVALLEEAAAARERGERWEKP